MFNWIQDLWKTHPRSLVLSWVFACLSVAALGWYFELRSVLPGPASLESLMANPGERIAFTANLRPEDSLAVILSNENKRYDAAEFQTATEALYDYVKGIQNSAGSAKLFTRVQTLNHTQLDDEIFRARDGHHILLQAKTNIPISSAPEELEHIPALLDEWQRKHPDFQLRYISEGTVDNEMFELIHRDLDRSLLFTVPLTLAILYWAFGSFFAALLPLGMALLSLVASLGTCALLSHIFGPINATATQLVVLLVLAIGVDYCLFTVCRVREELRKQPDLFLAISVAQKTTGRAVFWSGLTVALSLVGLLLMQDMILCSMALVAIVSVIITVFGCIVVLPAVLLLLAPLFDFQSIINSGLSADIGAGIISRWLRVSVRNPIPVLVLSALVLGALSTYSRKLQLGSTIESSMLPPSMQSAQAYDLIDKAFPDLSGIDFTLVLKAPNLADLEFDGKLQSFIDKIHEQTGVRGPLETRWSEDGTVARYEFLASGGGNDERNIQLISRLESQILPQEISSLGVEVHLSGTLPYVVENNRLYAERTPLVFSAVLLCSLAFLLAAFQSLVVPIKAILLNALSTAASFGVLVICFQSPFLSDWNYGVIESFVPALLFAILFGLSMDYHVFLLSRVREEVARGLSTHDAVEKGIQETSGAITSAALIMVSVFLVIASLELPMMKQLGVGLAVVIFLDATIVRSLLLPASMVLLGDWNWYLPKSLGWLPQLHPEEAASITEV